MEVCKQQLAGGIIGLKKKNPKKHQQQQQQKKIENEETRSEMESKTSLLARIKQKRYRKMKGKAGRVFSAT